VDSKDGDTLVWPTAENAHDLLRLMPSQDGSKYSDPLRARLRDGLVDLVGDTENRQKLAAARD